MLLAAVAALLAQEAAPRTPVIVPPETGAIREFRARRGVPGARVDARRCDELLHRALGAGAVERTDEGVRMYHLLDRFIDGCPAPVVVAQQLPGADAALGRNLATVPLAAPPEAAPVP
jgi:hypothetical protein